MELEWLDGMSAGRVVGGKYQVLGKIGAGASASVYSGLNVETSQRVAMKVIDRLEVEDDPRRVQQMERELNITMKLKHAHIVNLLDVVFEEQLVILISELAEDGALFDKVGRSGPFPVQRAADAMYHQPSARTVVAIEPMFNRWRD
eukprot:SAG11_NODE_4292_length_1966_cov_2.988216_1_plen_146_part_00